MSELSRELELTKSNTFRLLKTLCTLGYVRQDENSTYSATIKAWQIGRPAVDPYNLRHLCSAEIEFLASETGETIYLAVPEDGKVIYIDKIDGQKPFKTWNPIGGEAPMHCVGTGKAMLAVDWDNRKGRLVKPLPRFTDKTITDLEALEADLETARQKGYAFDQGEFRERILSFGAPITTRKGEVVGAIGISLPDVNLPEGGAERFGGLVMHAASNITHKLAEL